MTAMIQVVQAKLGKGRFAKLRAHVVRDSIMLAWNKKFAAPRTKMQSFVPMKATLKVTGRSKFRFSARPDVTCLKRSKQEGGFKPKTNTRVQFGPKPPLHTY